MTQQIRILDGSYKIRGKDVDLAGMVLRMHTKTPSQRSPPSVKKQMRRLLKDSVSVSRCWKI